MNSEFNAKDLISLDEMILKLKSKKQGLVTTKINLQNTLTNISNGFASKETKKNKGQISQSLQQLDNEIKKINVELSYKNKLRLEIESSLKSFKSEDSVIISNRINTLKKKYQDFAKDRTRVASLRVMASEFIQELESILK